ncbi:response regulator [Metabacillus fastidiosus]|uniref:response regulator n=2 Tax=Metabacillus fastidiosus TaxID=1458 RepID=UPI00082434AF|nr:response regulator [Metabacillus fastidiosus]MED4454031.1 response regulator [Metabacillus fastidiosus]MED4460789.1 response regulator [Metabacillus fastidiosus]
MMNIILVDDEQLALDLLENRLVKINGIKVIDKFLDPISCLEGITDKQVDIVFLDINLPEMNGLELAEKILEKKPNVNIVFVTAYDEYAVKAFEINALDYIMKPVKFDRLEKTIARILNQYVNNEKKQILQEENIRVNVFRQLTIEAEGGRIENIPWRTAKTKELFLFLLQHREQLVRKSLLIELFWPEHELEKAYSQLYTTVYHVRKKLKKFSEHFQISNTTEGYILNLTNVILDMEEWENYINSHSTLNMEIIEEYIEKMNLYTGDYLQEYDYLWAENERYRLQCLWLQAAMKVAGFYYDHGDVEKSITWYLNICSLQPEAEESHFALMKIYAERNNQLLVRQQYEKLKKILKEELNETPSSSVEKWFNEWNKVLRRR